MKTNLSTQTHAPGYDKEFIRLCRHLPLQKRKIIIREVDYENSSAWMFYMGLGKEKGALVVVDRFTIFPLSLARVCNHVIVYGMPEQGKKLLEMVLQRNGVENCSCVSDLESIATQFDLIVFKNSLQSANGTSLEELKKYSHPDTEFWALAENGFNFGKFKKYIKNFFVDVSDPNDTHEHLSKIYPGHPKKILTVHEAQRQFRELGVKPSAYIGFHPSIHYTKIAHPVNGSTHSFKTNGTLGFRERMQITELAIGASKRKFMQSLLGNLLDSLPETSLIAGKMLNFSVLAGGKVYVRASYKNHAKSEEVMIKLPLNRISEKRSKVNQMMLAFLKSSENDRLRNRVPLPIAEGRLENQPFFVESIVPGAPMIEVSGYRQKPNQIAMHAFPFWLAIQRDFAKSVEVDEQIFERLIAKPVSKSLNFAFQDHPDTELETLIFDYLRKHFLNKTFTLSIMHGDFSAKNIMFDARHDRICGIIDWDMARLEAFPVLDVFHFFSTSVMHPRECLKFRPCIIL